MFILRSPSVPRLLIPLILFTCARPTSAQAADEIVPAWALYVEGLPDRTGEQLALDPVEAAILLAGREALNPHDGQSVLASQPDAVTWTAVTLNEQGGVDQRQPRDGGSYLYVPIESEQERVMILAAGGHDFVYVNGAPRAGNRYGYGYSTLPVLLQPGHNELIFRLSWRSRLRIKLVETAQPVYLLGDDLTLPDLIADEPIDTLGAIVIVNAQTAPARNLQLRIRGEQLETTTQMIDVVPPMTIRKVGFAIQGHAPTGSQPIQVVAELEGAPDTARSSQTFELQVRHRDQSVRQTFVSDLDGSVQYFAMRQATPLASDLGEPAIVLSCHGASVEASSQSAAYSTKSWLHLVAPTNRRPFGFDWEDFGRADALEVLQIAKQTLPHDPSRIYLTGHSMGGHGTWHIGTTFPDKFAAIGPSAGWVSYNLYRRDRESDEIHGPFDEILKRGNTASDTLALAANLKHHGVYILHGSADDNVPPHHSEMMAKKLSEIHHDWFYHEEPGMGHWWSNAFDDGGATCMDWPDMYDMFARHALPPTNSIRHVEFVTANPGVSSQCHWLAIEAQQRQHQLSRAEIMTWPSQRKLEGTTENVAVLRLETQHFRSEGPLSVQLDGQTLDGLTIGRERLPAWFEKRDQQWFAVDRPDAKMKGPHRYGSIKSELRNRFLFVYGTHGSADETAAIYDKARFDAETYWYRGNASVDFVADDQFDPSQYADRTVVLYGSADSNSAWNQLLPDCPVQVSTGHISVGTHSFDGQDLAALFLRPRHDSHLSSVIAVGASGAAGMRQCYPLSFFVPFIRYPDLLILRAPQVDADRANALGAGFFGLDWSLEKGEFVWQEH